MGLGVVCAVMTCARGFRLKGSVISPAGEPGVHPGSAARGVAVDRDHLLQTSGTGCERVHGDFAERHESPASGTWWAEERIDDGWSGV